jgi:hypothetical protein
MQKDDFEEHTRYALTLTDEQGHLRPFNLYVYRKYDDFMIVRRTDREGLLYKMPYEKVERIVRRYPVAHKDQLHVPEALLNRKAWQGREVMSAYSSAPHRGK